MPKDKSERSLATLECRCKKKNIACRVPETFTVDDNGVEELDAVHAAQDLLDLSNGFDYGSPVPFPDSTQTSTPRLNDVGKSEPSFQLPSIPVAQMTVPNDLRPNGRERSSTTSKEAMNQLYAETGDTISSFFDSTMSNFDETTSIDPFLPDYFRNMPPLESFLSGHVTPRGIMDLNFDMDVGLTDLDLGLLDQYNFQIPFTAGTPSTDAQGLEPQPLENDSAPVRTEAFKHSIWRYLPRRDRDHSGMEQTNLAFPDSDKDHNRRAHLPQRRAINERLGRVSRDRLMALVLGTCSPENVKRIASAFPSVELLDGLIQIFLTSPALDVQSWFHLPTLSLAKLSPELLACIVSAGAASTPDVPLRKLGFALHEAARMGQSKSFEEDNSAIRDLQHVTTFLLQLVVGMWSGVSRKMEIAESFLQPLVTMIRRGGRLRHSTWRDVVPLAEDDGPALEVKWQEWAHQESYLRLIYRVFELDRQSSMALLKPPLMTYSEMHLPLPCSNHLWLAKSAVAWKAAYLENAWPMTKRPSAIDCFLDLDHLAQHDSASTIYLHMMWGMVWEFRQMSSLGARSPAKGHDSLILSSRYQELTKQIENFHVGSPPMTKTAEITMELMLLHLNAPLDDIQLFAGIEGQQEARSAYPLLRDWTKTVSARQALWHAGQVLRAAESLPKGLLCNFNAIAVYHAGLILWGYGFLKGSTPEKSTPGDTSYAAVLLNGDDTLDTRRFITLDRGVPSIKTIKSRDTVQLTNVAAVMDGLVQLLLTPYESVEGSSPPLVGNLVQLLEGLRPETR
ncbi:nucleic acid binding [Ascochyta rabiei]|uniref:Nucleic acid binding n=1 Tax=Didymella rabiei TaxID=5454 RepID=A0A162XXK8_DIDRA|nr:nucleic acid binding [Ascochyta rabiei]